MLRIHRVASVAFRAAARPISRNSLPRALPSCSLLRPCSARWLSTKSDEDSGRPRSPAQHSQGVEKNEDRRMPTSNADEQTDAESGLNTPVKKAPPFIPAEPASSSAAASAVPPPSNEKQSSEREREQRQRESEFQKIEKTKSPASVTWASFAFIVIGGAAAVAYGLYRQDTQLNKVVTETIGTPLIGAPWELTDKSGKRVSSADHHGKYVLIYFGFTKCPDICPNELRRMGEVLDTLDRMGVVKSVSPFFISIDPKRDTPKQLTEYSKQWDPRIQWLTGTDQEMAKVAKDFRIYFSATSTASDEDEDYLLDHSTFFYLMDREGKFAEVFSPYNSPEEIAIKMNGIIQAEQGQKKR